MRGEIIHRDRARQIIDFSGLRFGNITPTDIDGMIEYHGKAFIYYEFKYLGAELQTGQRKALEQSVISHWDANRKAIAIVLDHDVEDWNKDIPAAQCRVREYYFNPKLGWLKPKPNETTLEITLRFFKLVGYDARQGA